MWAVVEEHYSRLKVPMLQPVRPPRFWYGLPFLRIFKPPARGNCASDRVENLCSNGGQLNVQFVDVLGLAACISWLLTGKLPMGH